MKPKYQSVADALRQEIAVGTFQDGEALLTEEELRNKFSVSRQTIRQAISLLEGDGLVVRRRGSGTYVAHGPRRHGNVLNVGVITTYITDYIFPSIVRGIESVLSTENCTMSLSATYNHVGHEGALLERYLATPVDGLIIEGTRTALENPNLALFEKLRERNIPYVFINGYYPQLSHGLHVVMDDEAGGYAAAKTLITAGHTRIGGIFKQDDMQGQRRYRGFLSALQDAGLHPSDADICWFDTDNKKCFFEEPYGRAYRQRLGGELDAVVCYNDEIALMLLDFFRVRALSVPEDISLISFDNSAYTGICSPGLTSLSHLKDEFGRIAAQKLMSMMHGGQEESSVLPWELVVRESIRK